MRLGKLIQYEIKNQTAVLEFENGEARIEVLTPAIINVYQGKAEERVPSKAIEGVKSVPTEIHAERREDSRGWPVDSYRGSVREGQRRFLRGLL